MKLDRLSLVFALTLAACKAGPPAGYERRGAAAFTVEVPAAWHAAAAQGGPEQALYLSPASQGPGLASLWVRVYGKGDPIYESAQAYLAALTAPGPRRELHSKEKREEGGRDWWVVRLSRPRPGSPERDPAPPQLYEAQAVLDSPSGFVVLGAGRPIGDAYWDAHSGELDAHFERLVASYKTP